MKSDEEIIRDYLTVVEARVRAGVSAGITDEELTKMIEDTYQATRRATDPIRRLELISRRRALEVIAHLHPTNETRDQFVEAARRYSIERGIEASTWREIRLPDSLIAAMKLPDRLKSAPTTQMRRSPTTISAGEKATISVSADAYDLIGRKAKAHDTTRVELGSMLMREGLAHFRFRDPQTLIPSGKGAEYRPDPGFAETVEKLAREHDVAPGKIRRMIFEIGLERL